MLPIVSGILGPVVRNAASAAGEQFTRLWGVEREIRTLAEKLESIQNFLENPYVGQDMSERMPHWLRNVRDIAYDIDDLLDDCATEAALQSEGLWEEADRGALCRWKRQACDSLCLVSDCCLTLCFSNPTRVSFRRELTSRIESIKERLDAIEKDTLYLNLIGMVGSETRQMQSRGMWSRPETSPLLKKGWSLVGRDREMRKITEELLGAECVDEPETLKVIAIVGFGGLGKTTLAQAIFNDQKVQGSFSIKKWLFVGEKFDAKRLIKDIIGDGDKSQNVGGNLGDLQDKLVERLQGQKFLIILDDVWTKNRQDWDPLWTALTYLEKGSMIILTTRSKKVARAIGYSSMHVLEGLPDEECWEIFKSCTFPGGDSKAYPYQESLGREMVKKLKGVPLAASMMGGFLHGFLHNKEKWKSVLENRSWAETGSKDLVDHVIGLSYQHLPWHLRLCFGYCSIFPKDFEFDKSSLVRMWMALGYIRPQDGRRPEDIGSEYFDDLHDGSFFQHVRDDSFFQHVRYRYMMHDLVHDFAQKVFEEGHHMTAGRDCRWPSEQVRHLSVYYNELSDWSELKKLRKFKKLRTLCLKWESECESESESECESKSESECESESEGEVPASVLDASLTEFKYVRVLTLSTWPRITELPDSIGHLRLLRYLDVSLTGIFTMPKSLCNLHNLQTLQQPHSSSNLPEGWTRLVNLRHLKRQPDSSNMKGIGRLTLLQWLESFTVYNDLGIKITELQNMNCLRGKLCIYGLESVEGREEAKLATLVSKVHLEELKLGWAGIPLHEFGVWDESLELKARHYNDSEVLEALQLPPNLRKLEIRNNYGLQLPSWMVQQQQLQLPSTLVSLELMACYFLAHLPHLAHLSFLEELTVGDCPGIQCLPEGGLPSSLKKFSIYRCPRLLKHCRARDLGQHVISEDRGSVIFQKKKEASISGWLAFMASRVTSLSFEEFIERCGVEERIVNLSEKLQSVQAVLEDATMSDTQYGMSGLMGFWLERLKAVAYDIEDMLDDYAIHASDDSVICPSDCFTLNPTEASFHLVIENRLKSIREKLEAIEKNEHHLNPLDLDSGGGTSESQLKQSQASEWKSVPFPEKGKLLIGRDTEMMMIKQELLAYVNQGETSAGSRHGQQLPFGGNVPIIGIVGWHPGKTTLVQAIFDDEEVKASFNMRMWLFVEYVYVEGLIIKGIISDGGSIPINIGENMVDLKKKLRDKLQGNRCLLVLDDVGEKGFYVGKPELESFRDIAESGTVIIFTKGNRATDSSPGINYYKLDKLSGEMCWKIFEGRAFPCGDSGVRGLRERIAKALNGDPLTASMLGGLLGGYLHDENKSEWLLNRFLEYPLANNVIGLTYQHLPWHLKLCLAYCSTFPNTYVFDKSKMVQMWIAQGYVQPQEGRQLEDVGSDYFDDLHRISAFHCIGGKYVMQKRVCGMKIGDGVQMMHKRVCGFDQWMKDGAHMLHSVDASQAKHIHHLSFICDDLVWAKHIHHLSFSCDELVWAKKLRDLKRLRTFRLKCEMCSPSDLDELLAEFKYVRVLELDCRKIVQLPPSIRRMKLLRYLDISKTAISTRPDLPNLQYLECSGASITAI